MRKEKLIKEIGTMLKEHIEKGEIHFTTKKNRYGTATHIKSYYINERNQQIPLNTFFNIVTECRLLTNGDISIKGSGFNAVQHLLATAWYKITNEERYTFSYK